MDDTTPATKGDLQKLEQSLYTRFELIDQKFELIDQKFELIDQKFELIDQKFETLTQQVSRLNRGFDRMHEDIDSVLNMLVHTKKTTDDHEERIVALEHAVAA